MTHLAFATIAELENVGADEQLLEEALRKRGIQVSHAAWDDPGVNWACFDSVLLRSTWNYHLQPDAFRAWLSHLDVGCIPTINPTELVRWNMDKGYLQRLDQMGIPIVETVMIKPDASVDVAEIMAQRGWGEVVVKPAISATAFQTNRFPAAQMQQVRACVSALLASGGVLIQPFVPEILQDGEYSVLYFGGSFSHAVIKRATGNDFRVQNDFGGTSEVVHLPTAIQQQTDAVVAKIPGKWCYARVDGVVREGIFLLMELELIEPQLFLEEFPESAVLFADVLVNQLSPGQ